MAALAGSTRHLIVAILTTMAFLPAVVSQSSCTNSTLRAHNNQVGYFNSYGYPSNYPNNMACKWTIATDYQSQVVVLTLLDFLLEGTSPNCTFDYVAIYDGPSTSSQRNDLMCGSYTSGQVFSTGSWMTVVFHSDMSLTFSGFKFEYTAQDKSAVCGSTARSANGTEQYIISPGYPISYSRNMACQWTITAGYSSQKVLLTLVDFLLEGPFPSCQFDYVAIYDGPSTSSQRTNLLCGSYFGGQFTSTGRYMTVVFHSDGSNTYRGFKFGYTSKAPCTNSSILAYHYAQNFTSPGYPNNYNNNTACQWTITADLPSDVVVLTLLDFSLQSCTSDYVYIYDGPSTSSLRTLLCGSHSIGQFISTGRYMTVVFHSDGSSTSSGFKFGYTSNSVVCTNTTISATRTAQYLTSPGYPSSYTSNMDCQWVLTSNIYSDVVVLELLDISLEFSTLCTNDYVAIYDGYSTSSPIIHKLCGSSSVTQFTSTGPYMTVAFHSDGSFNYRGFQFEYTSQQNPGSCTNSSSLAYHYAQNFTSPSYPNNYNNNMACQWTLTAELSSDVVVLTLLNFSLEGSGSPCPFDNVSIYDGPSTSSNRMELLCGYYSSGQFVSTGRYMTVVFRSDGSSTSSGFKFSYTSNDKSALCTNTTLYATGTAQYLTSTGYPSSYKSNMDCQWVLTSNIYSDVMVLKLLNFSLEYSTSCTNDYVAIYDGYRTSSPIIRKLCGSSSVTQFTSTSPYMTVAFHSDGSYNYQGFKFEYTSQQKPAACTGGTLTAYSWSNYLQSSNYPQAYPSNTQCEWHITAEYSKNVELDLIYFQLDGNGFTCNNDYVKIYDGSSTSSPALGVLCGSLSFKTLQSTGRDMTVVFHSDWESNSYTGFSFTYQSHTKVYPSSDSGSKPGIYNSSRTIVIATTSCAAVALIALVVVGVCIKKRQAKGRARNARNRILTPVVNANSLFVIDQAANRPEATAPNVTAQNYPGPYDPPSYSSLNLDVNSGLAHYSPRSPVYGVDDLPPAYTPDLPDGTLQHERNPLFIIPRPETSQAGANVARGGGGHINRAFSSDEGVRDERTGNIVSAGGINRIGNTNMAVFVVTPREPTSYIARNPSLSAAPQRN